MKKDDLLQLYNCIVLGNYKGFEKYEKYHCYFEKFYANFCTNTNYLATLVYLLDKYYGKFRMAEKVNVDVIDAILEADRMQLVGISTGDAINALGLLLNRQEYPFDYNYYKYFKVLFDAANKLDCEEFGEVNKYRKVSNEVRGYVITKYKNMVDEGKYNNFQYNYYMLVLFATSYAYYMNYEPEKISDIVDFFIRNYEQIINIFDVNGFTKEDLSLNTDGLSYYMHYYEKNNEKDKLKRIL